MAWLRGSAAAAMAGYDTRHIRQRAAVADSTEKHQLRIERRAFWFLLIRMLKKRFGALNKQEVDGSIDLVLRESGAGTAAGRVASSVCPLAGCHHSTSNLHIFSHLDPRESREDNTSPLNQARPATK